MAPPKKNPAKKATKSTAKAGASTPAAKVPAAKPMVTKQIASAAGPVAVARPAPPPPLPVPALPDEPIDLHDREAIEAYQDLYEKMGMMRWQMTDVDDIERIQEARDQVYDILTRLNKAQLASNTAAYDALMPTIDDSNKQLDGIRKGIASIVKNITIAGTITSAIARVLGIVTAL